MSVLCIVLSKHDFCFSASDVWILEILCYTLAQLLCHDCLNKHCKTNYLVGYMDLGKHIFFLSSQRSWFPKREIRCLWDIFQTPIALCTGLVWINVQMSGLLNYMVINGQFGTSILSIRLYMAYQLLLPIGAKFVTQEGLVFDIPSSSCR